MIDFNEFYRENHERQIRMMRKHVSFEEAEDIVQEAYARAMKYQASYDEERSSINTWFNSILFNVLKTFKSGEVITEPYEEERTENVAWDDKDKTIFKEEYALVKNQKHRYILELFFVLGYTSREISQIVNDISVTNVTTVIARFRKKLQGKYHDII